MSKVISHKKALW